MRKSKLILLVLLSFFLNDAYTQIKVKETKPEITFDFFKDRYDPLMSSVQVFEVESTKGTYSKEENQLILEYNTNYQIDGKLIEQSMLDLKTEIGQFNCSKTNLRFNDIVIKDFCLPEGFYSFSRFLPEVLIFDEIIVLEDGKNLTDTVAIQVNMLDIKKPIEQIIYKTNNYNSTRGVTVDVTNVIKQSVEESLDSEMKTIESTGIFEKIASINKDPSNPRIKSSVLPRLYRNGEFLSEFTDEMKKLGISPHEALIQGRTIKLSGIGDLAEKIVKYRLVYNHEKSKALYNSFLPAKKNTWSKIINKTIQDSIVKNNPMNEFAMKYVSSEKNRLQNELKATEGAISEYEKYAEAHVLETTATNAWHYIKMAITAIFALGFASLILTVLGKKEQKGRSVIVQNQIDEHGKKSRKVFIEVDKED